jgi:hypothetical protein
MIASDRLAAWLGDRGRQAATTAAMTDFLRDWHGEGALANVRAELTGLVAPQRHEVVELARRLFDRLPVADVVEALIARCRADPFFLPPLHLLTSEVHSGLLLFHHEHLSVGLGVTGLDLLAAKKTFRRGGASIAFTGVSNLFRYIKAGDALLSFWEAPRITGGFRAEQAGECRLIERRRIQDGEEFLIDGSRESFVIEHAAGDIVYLQATVQTGAAPLIVEYDSDSLQFVNASSADEASSRVQMMATLLREMDREDAVPVLRELLGTPHFYTRWHMMREMLALDADAALPDLQLMAACDPHPEVRAAAARTLTLFFADAPARREPEPCPA